MQLPHLAAGKSVRAAAEKTRKLRRSSEAVAATMTRPTIECSRVMAPDPLDGQSRPALVNDQRPEVGQGSHVTKGKERPTP